MIRLGVNYLQVVYGPASVLFVFHLLPASNTPPRDTDNFVIKRIQTGEIQSTSTKCNRWREYGSILVYSCTLSWRQLIQIWLNIREWCVLLFHYSIFWFSLAFDYWLSKRQTASLGINIYSHLLWLLHLFYCVIYIPLAGVNHKIGKLIGGN